MAVLVHGREGRILEYELANPPIVWLPPNYSIPMDDYMADPGVRPVFSQLDAFSWEICYALYLGDLDACLLHALIS